MTSISPRSSGCVLPLGELQHQHDGTDGPDGTDNSGQDGLGCSRSEKKKKKKKETVAQIGNRYTSLIADPKFDPPTQIDCRSSAARAVSTQLYRRQSIDRRSDRSRLVGSAARTPRLRRAVAV